MTHPALLTRKGVALLLTAALALLCTPVDGAAPHLPVLDDPVAYVVRRGELEMSLFKEKVNDTLDIFGVKSGEVADISARPGLDIGSIGDLDGWDGIVNFGLTDRLQARYVRKSENIQFGFGSLHRQAEEVALRSVLWSEGHRRPAISLEPIYRANRGSGLKRTFAQFDAFGLTIIPTKPVDLEFGGVHDATYALRALATKHLSDGLLLSVWGELGKTDVSSELSTNLPLTQIQTILDALSYSSHEVTLGGSVHLSLGERWEGYAEYTHYGLNRSIDAMIPDVVDSNNRIVGRIGYRVAKQTWLNLSGTYFTNQLAGEVPFLFNKLSASRFDKKYGYVGLGMTFQVSYGD